jgi:hypothetical protein
MVKRLLLLLALFSGCKTWNVNAFGVPLDGKERYVSAAAELSSEEKVGVIVVLAVAIGVGVAIAVSD